MATEDQVKQRRAENDQLRAQLAEARGQQAVQLAEANNDVAMERANREHDSLEAELASLMGNRASAEVSAPPPPDTSLVPNEHPEGE
jgi:hypothetical protein